MLKLPFLYRRVFLFANIKNGLSISSNNNNLTHPSTANKLFNIFEKQGLIYFNRQGRENLVYLTKKGKQIQVQLKYIILTLLQCEYESEKKLYQNNQGNKKRK